MPTLLTASIVLYNTKIEMVCRAIDSFLASTIESKLLIIVDNNSSNTTFLDLQKIYKSGVLFVHSAKNLGYGAGHNLAFKNYPGSKYFMVVNPDIIFTENSIENMINLLENNRDVGSTVPKIYNNDGTVQHLNKIEPTISDLFLRRFVPKIMRHLYQKRDYKFTMQDVGYENNCIVPYASGCCMLFRSDLYKSINGFDEKIFLHMEDADISKRINKISKIIFCANAKVFHEWQRDNHKSLRITLITIKSALYYFKKHEFKWF